MTYSTIVTAFLDSAGYPKNDDGIYIVDISHEKFDFWEDLESSKADYPYFEMKKLLDEMAEEYPKAMAEDIRVKMQEEGSAPEGVTAIELEEKILNILSVKIQVCYSMDKILDRVENVDICIDTGDSGWDFRANTVRPACGAYYTLRRVKRCASMVWLVKQQGHTVGELGFALKNIVHNPDDIYSPFVRSVANEVYHEMCDENMLTFLVKMTVRELLIINSLIKWRRKTKKWGGYIVVNPQATAGFFSSSQGSTSLLGIEPEKEVKIPTYYIYSVLPDSAYESSWRYFPSSILSVIGDEELWEKGRVVYKSLPKHFRADMESMGLEFIPKNVRSTELS